MEQEKETHESVFRRTLIGFMSGLAGAVVVVILFFGAQIFVEPVFDGLFLAQEQEYFIPAIMIISLFALTIANGLGSTLMIFARRGMHHKPHQVKECVIHSVIMNIALFCMMTPMYVIGVSVWGAVLWFHALLSILASMLVFESMVQTKSLIAGLYGTLVGLFLASWIVFQSLQQGATVLTVLIIALPMMWTFTGFFRGTISLLYEFLMERMNK